jgi:hypothetical protein
MTSTKQTYIIEAKICYVYHNSLIVVTSQILIQLNFLE